MEDIRESIEREVGSWEGVTVHPHRFGGVEFRVGKRELGHLHETWADLPFTSRIRAMLVETGRAEPHRFGVRGWVSRDLDDEAIELFRLSYERALVAQNVRASRDQLGEPGGADVPAGDDHSDAVA
ncbi:MAG TPA: luciferase family protein [Gaiellaceae bacterium]